SAPHLGHGLAAAAGLAADFDVAGVGDDLLDALAHDVVVVDDEHFDHDALPDCAVSSRRMETMVPRPDTPSTCAVPPRISARSRMPARPREAASVTWSAVLPRPSSRISSRRGPPRSRTRGPP